MRVQKSLQVHPKSPRLWVTLIHKIITQLGFTPCHHEPCLYVNTNYNKDMVYFSRQLDNFAVSAPSKSTTDAVVVDINSKMTIDIKSLGTVDRFNGVDIDQTRNHIQYYNKTYIEMILKDKNWLDATISGDPHRAYISMHSDPEYNNKIEDAIPIPEKEFPSIESEMGFTYK